MIDAVLALELLQHTLYLDSKDAMFVGRGRGRGRGLGSGLGSGLGLGMIVVIVGADTRL